MWGFDDLMSATKRQLHGHCRSGGLDSGPGRKQPVHQHKSIKRDNAKPDRLLWHWIPLTRYIQFQFCLSSLMPSRPLRLSARDRDSSFKRRKYVFFLLFHPEAGGAQSPRAFPDRRNVSYMAWRHGCTAALPLHSRPD